MPRNDLTENKLILLYTIREKQGINSIELSDFIVFKEYMDYFSMQEMLQQLKESELILETDHFYTITPAGEAVLNTFLTRIPHSTREDITEFSTTSAYGRSSMLDISGEITEKAGAYKVKCTLKDYDQTVMSITLDAADEQEAFAIRNSWQNRAITIYRNLIQDLKGL